MLNTRINYPVNTGSNIVTATELEVLNDQALLFGTGPNNADISLTALAAPGGIAVGQLGTAGATSYT